VQQAQVVHQAAQVAAAVHHHHHHQQQQQQQQASQSAGAFGFLDPFLSGDGFHAAVGSTTTSSNSSNHTAGSASSGLSLQDLSSLFYKNNGLVRSFQSGLADTTTSSCDQQENSEGSLPSSPLYYSSSPADSLQTVKNLSCSSVQDGDDTSSCVHNNGRFAYAPLPFDVPTHIRKSHLPNPQDLSLPSSSASSSEQQQPIPSDSRHVEVQHYHISKKRLLAIVVFMIPFFLHISSAGLNLQYSTFDPSPSESSALSRGLLEVAVVSSGIVYSYLEIFFIVWYLIGGGLGIKWAIGAVLWLKALPEVNAYYGSRSSLSPQQLDKRIEKIIEGQPKFQ